MQSRATDPWPPGTFVLVSRAPSPQKVPPPMELPPTHSNLSSVSTWHRTREKQVPEVWWPRGVPWHGRDALEGHTWAGGECAPLTARGPLPWTRTVGTCVRRAVPAWPWHAAGARHTWAAPSLSHEAEPHLHDGHSGADVDEEVREDVGVIGLEPELGVGVFLTHEGFVWDVLQHEVAPLYQAGHHVLFVHPARGGARPLRTAGPAPPRGRPGDSAPRPATPASARSTRLWPERLAGSPGLSTDTCG